ncbi:hydrolase [Nocardioides sp. Soil797]|nr:hydrolase [Nocardioides sp. Soil797]
MSRVLLLSGGLDSTSVAAWQRPEHCLVIDYGQRAAAAERRAAAAVATDLDLPYTHITVNASAVSGGLMANQPHSVGETPEWWPYRNQFLITVAAGWAVLRAYDEILVGTVAGDGDRHADGTQTFYDAMTAVLQSQEGRLSVSAPAIHLAAPALIHESNVTDSTLGWTHSCHVDNLPCGRCPGCVKRAEVLARAERLQ